MKRSQLRVESCSSHNARSAAGNSLLPHLAPRLLTSTLQKGQTRYRARWISRESHLRIDYAQKEQVCGFREQRRLRLARGQCLQTAILESDRDRQLRRYLILTDIST